MVFYAHNRRIGWKTPIACRRKPTIVVTRFATRQLRVFRIKYSIETPPSSAQEQSTRAMHVRWHFLRFGRYARLPGTSCWFPELNGLPTRVFPVRTPYGNDGAEPRIACSLGPRLPGRQSGLSCTEKAKSGRPVTNPARVKGIADRRSRRPGSRRRIHVGHDVRIGIARRTRWRGDVKSYSGASDSDSDAENPVVQGEDVESCATEHRKRVNGKHIIKNKNVI